MSIFSGMRGENAKERLLFQTGCQDMPWSRLSGTVAGVTILDGRVAFLPCREYVGDMIDLGGATLIGLE